LDRKLVINELAAFIGVKVATATTTNATQTELLLNGARAVVSVNTAWAFSMLVLSRSDYAGGFL
jgi:hypothetical protein